MTDQLTNQELRPRLGTTLPLLQASVHLHAAELPHAVGPLDLPRVVELPDPVSYTHLTLPTILRV